MSMSWKRDGSTRAADLAQLQAATLVGITIMDVRMQGTDDPRISRGYGVPHGCMRWREKGRGSVVPLARGAPPSAERLGALLITRRALATCNRMVSPHHVRGVAVLRRSGAHGRSARYALPAGRLGRPAHATCRSRVVFPSHAVLPRRAHAWHRRSTHIAWVWCSAWMCALA